MVGGIEKENKSKKCLPVFRHKKECLVISANVQACAKFGNAIIGTKVPQHCQIWVERSQWRGWQQQRNRTGFVMRCMTQEGVKFMRKHHTPDE